MAVILAHAQDRGERAALFRAEAIEAHGDDGFGRTLSLRLRGAWVLSAGFAAIAVAAVAVAVVGEYTRKESVPGVLVTAQGALKVVSPQAGVVQSLSVGEGARVRHGDVLAVIGSDQSTSSAQQAQASVQRELRARRDSLERERIRQGELDALSERTLRQRVQALELQLRQARDQADLQHARIAGAQRQLERQRVLRADAFVSEAAVQQKEEELIDQRAQLASLLRAQAALQADLNGAHSEASAARLRAASAGAALDRQMSELDQQLVESEVRRTVVLTAPADGTVTTLLTGVGQTVSANAALMTVLPSGAELRAELLLPTRASGFVAPGQPVTLRYRAFPYQRFGHATGEVVDIGGAVISPGDAGIVGAGIEAGYRVSVRLPAQHVDAYGKAVPLRPGMALDADVQVDRRRIVDWLLDPVLVVKGRL